MKTIATLFTIAMLAGAAGTIQAQDASARTWLPVKGASEKATYDTTTTPLDKFLKGLNGRIRPVVCWYSGSLLDSTRAFANGNLKTRESQWTCEVKSSGKSDVSEKALDLTLTFKLVKGVAQSAGIAVAFDFSNWTTDNYILVPAVLYGGNRFHILPINYPPYIYDEKDKPLDMPITATNILHLNPDGSHAKVEMNTGNVATPMLSFFNPKKKRGFILLAEQGTRFGNNGLFVEEDAGPKSKKKRMTFVVSAPGVREQRYVMCGRAASGDHGAEWKTGDEMTHKFKVYNFAADDIPAFYEKVFDIRKALTGDNSYTCVTPYSAAANLILEHTDKDKWFEDEKTAYYSNHPGDRNPYDYQLGWGGAPNCTFPSLIAETPERLRRVCLTLDNKIFNAQGKTGLFYAIYRDGEILGDPHGKMEEFHTISLTRRSMIVLDFCLRDLVLMKRRGHADMIKPEWKKSLRTCADGLVKVWEDYGQFGKYIDVDNGKMDVNGSTAGCFAGVPLVLAAQYFNDPKYLKVAEAVTKMYYQRDFLKGYAGGTSPDILQGPESQSAWEMIGSSMAIYGVTGKQEWVERAKFAAHMFSTWMVSYDYRFPKGSAMESAGTHATGSIFASSQNNHSTPGSFEFCGDCLLKLFRATGDRRYAEMHKDQSHNAVQYVGASHNPLRREKGYVTERVQISDWEGKNSVGHVNYKDSHMGWETQVVLNCLENPGIYLHTDDDTFLILDHVEAQVIKRDKTGVMLRITNPTAYDARVSILAETAKQAKKPLPTNAFNNWPKVEVKAGETRTVTIARDGQIKP